jgi:acetylornithine/succinyldiaminopimelate/putrescine aminotransferase
MENPVLGHITTFGGHPLSCAAGLAAMKVLLSENIMASIGRKEDLLKSFWEKANIKSVRSFGLWQAIQFESFEKNKEVIDTCIKNHVLTDWFLFAPDCLRISPPLNIEDEDLSKAANTILKAIK